MTKKDQDPTGFKNSIDLINRLTSKITNVELVNFRETLYDYDNIIIIGNGGSNSIASHIAVDYNKFLKKKTLAFTDASMLTGYFNDYGLEKVYVKFIEQNLTKKTLVILISSSGNSLNILECANFCEKNKIAFCSLTGFNKNNKVKVKSEKSKNCKFNYWVDSKSYGVVENCHQIFLHAIVVN